jgi:tetratricopeptide (TPR) repeat protein
MRSTLSLAEGVLSWTARPGCEAERRPVGRDAETRLRRWAAAYERTLLQPDPWLGLVEIGREMYRWLDGDAVWLGRARDAAIAAPWIVDLVVPVGAGPVEVALLEAPWEVLSDALGPLAAQRELVFCPVRRWGRVSGEELASEQRLLAVFMTGLPEGAGDLALEAEETAILDATAGLGMDLLVEDSGQLGALGELLGQLGRVDLLHLSCHGAANPRPVLLLEDEMGEAVEATADDLDDALQPQRPRALFLSACETARGDRVLGSLAATLVRRGVPAVLGWGASVSDEEARRFAADLYQQLSRRGRLDEAVAWARLRLLGVGESGRGARDWHQARLFAGAAGGGALAVGVHGRAVRDRRQVVAKAFLDARGRVPVAGPEEFVGRRRDLQRVLRALRGGRLGVVVHGMGRQGKSSLALRVVQRLLQHRPLVLHGPFSGGALVEAIADAVAEPAARELVRQSRELVQEEGALADVLVQLLERFCARAEGEQRPLLFVLDDFEQLLEPGDLAPKRMAVGSLAPVRALLRALGRAESESKLLITSRYSFTLPWQGRDLAADLLAHALPAMGDADRRKQLHTKLWLLTGEASDPELLPRLVAAAQGNPGLQDLLTLLVVEAPERAERALAEMEARLAGTGDVEDEQLVAFFGNLALHELIGLVSPAERELLRVSTLFTIPVPECVMADLAAKLGLVAADPGVSGRLVGLGLWEVYSPDSGASLVLSELARPLAGTLSAEEERELARRVVAGLSRSWGAAWGQRSHSPLQNLELTRLALLAAAAEVVATCSEDAVAALERSLRNQDAMQLGRQAIELLDSVGTTVPLGLLRAVGELGQLTGDTALSRQLFGRAREAILQQLHSGEDLNAQDHGAVLVSHSRLLMQDGRIEDALACLEQAREIFKGAGRTREVAVTLSDIARIKLSRGEVEAALALHKEELQVYESLGAARERAVALCDIARIKGAQGEVEVALALFEDALQMLDLPQDAQSRAVTLSEIARIKGARGDLDAALALHEEALQILKVLGAAREQAVVLGDIARIKGGRGDLNTALGLHEERLRAYESLGAVRERAVVLGDIARIKGSRGDLDGALALHMERLRVFELLCEARERALTLGEIARIKRSRGDLDAAMALHREELEIYEALGAARERAVALGEIARVKWSLGEVDAALALHEERLLVYEELGDVRERAVTLGDIARVKEAGGDLDEAQALHEESLMVFEALGDADGKAHALSGLAGIDLQLGHLGSAVERLTEAYRINVELRRLEGTCHVGRDLGHILWRAGKAAWGKALLKRSLKGFRQLGQEDNARQVAEILAASPAALAAEAFVGVEGDGLGGGGDGVAGGPRGGLGGAGEGGAGGVGEGRGARGERGLDADGEGEGGGGAGGQDAERVNAGGAFGGVNGAGPAGGAGGGEEGV